MEVQAPDVPELPPKELLQGEKETTGLYMSGHPMAEYRRLSRLLNCAKTTSVISSSLTDPDSPYEDGEQVRILCILSAVRKKITRNNTTMAFLTLEDVYGSVECLVFPKMYDKIGQYLVEDEIVLLTGKVSLKDDEVPKLLCEDVVPVNEIPDDEALLQNYRLPDREYRTSRSASTLYVDGPVPDDDVPPPEEPDEPIYAATASSSAEPPAAQNPPVQRASAAAASRPSASAQSAQNARRVMYLRVPSADSLACARARTMCLYEIYEKKHGITQGLHRFP